MYDPIAQKPTIIEPRRSFWWFDLKEWWEYRELLYFLAWRDLKVRYKQTLLGAAWAVIDPVVNTVVFTLLFGQLAGLATDGLPPVAFYMAGLVIWKYFSTTLIQSSLSLVNSASMLSKIYFPRILVPTSTAMSGLLDFLLGLFALLILLGWLGAWPAWTVVFTPLLVLIAVATALGAGYFFAALNVRYRDVRHIIPFLAQIWMYITVIIPFSALPETLGRLRYLYALNPMAVVVEGFRWCLLHHHMSPEPRSVTMDHLPEVAEKGTQFSGRFLTDSQVEVTLKQTVEGAVQAPWDLLWIGVPASLVIFVLGLAYFRRVESRFADII